jgi:hypothetical protein
MYVYQIIVGALPFAALLICAVSCGGMAWMMMRGHQQKPPPEGDYENRSGPKSDGRVEAIK